MDMGGSVTVRFKLGSTFAALSHRRLFYRYGGAYLASRDEKLNWLSSLSWAQLRRHIASSVARWNSIAGGAVASRFDSGLGLTPGFVGSEICRAARDKIPLFY